MVDLPAVHLLHDVLLICELVNCRFLRLLRLYVRVAQEVIVPRFPGVPVALHQLHLRATKYHCAVAPVLLRMSIIAAAPRQRSCHMAARSDLSLPMLIPVVGPIILIVLPINMCLFPRLLSRARSSRSRPGLSCSTSCRCRRQFVTAARARQRRGRRRRKCCGSR